MNAQEVQGWTWGQALSSAPALCSLGFPERGGLPAGPLLPGAEPTSPAPASPAARGCGPWSREHGAAGEGP